MRRSSGWWKLCFWVVTFGAGGLGASCSDSSSDGEGDRVLGSEACEPVADRLRACGLLGDGPLFCTLKESEREESTCEQSCLVDADCATVSAAACSNEDPNTDGSRSLLECLAQCVEQFGFRCADPQTGPAGVPGRFQCDGEPDCADGSDELGCEQFECGGDERVVASWFCDGVPDCTNGRDEGDGCEHFRCADGSLVPARFQCDAYDDCDDASDEADCGLAEVQCP